MSTNAQALNFAVRAVNEANAALKSVQADIKDVGDKAEEADKKAGGLGSALGGVAKIAAGFIVAQGIMQLPGLIGGITSKATELELQAKKALTVFGEDSLGDVKDWAKEAAGAMGLTSKQAINLATNMADLLIPMGFSRDAAAELSTETIGLAGALAEWSGGTKSATDVADILTKAFLGETDGLKALGISISAAEVSAALLEKGQNKLTGAALQQAQALAIQELVLAKSTDAQTAFANGSDSAARKQAELKAAMAEAKEELATQLMPAVIAMQTFMAQYAIPALVGLAAAIGPGIDAAVNIAKPAFEWVMNNLPIVAGVVLAATGPVGALALALFKYRDDVLPAIQAFKSGVSKELEALGKWFQETGIPAATEYATRIVEVASALSEKLWPPLQQVLLFIKDHNVEVLDLAAAMASAIPVVLLLAAAHTTQAAAATAAATAELASGAAATVALAPILAIAAAVAVLVLGIVLLIQHWDAVVAKVPALGTAFNDVQAAAAALVLWWETTAAPWLESDLPRVAAIAGAALTQGLAAAVDYVLVHWQALKLYWETDLRPAWENIETVIRVLLLPILAAAALAFIVHKKAIEELVTWVHDHWGDIWAVIKPIIDLAVAHLKFFGTVFSELTKLFVDLIGGDFAGAWSDAKAIVEAFRDFFVAFVTNWGLVFAGALNLIGEILDSALSTMQGKIEAGMAAIASTITGALTTLIGAVYDAAVFVGKALVNGFKDGFANLWDAALDGIKSKLDPRNWPGWHSTVPEAIKIDALNMGNSLASGFGEGFYRAWPTVESGVKESLGVLLDDAVMMMKAAQPSLAGAISAPNTSEYAAFHEADDYAEFEKAAHAFLKSHPGEYLPPNPYVNPDDKLPSQGGKYLPKMAAGGIVTRPTLALIGEVPEAIVPLSRGGGYGANITINIHAWDSRDVARAIPELARELDRHLKRVGLTGVA